MTDPNSRKPLPPEVYKRRRIAAVVVLVLVLLLLWWLIGSLGGDEETQNAASNQKAQTTQTSSVAASDSATPTETKSESSAPGESGKNKEQSQTPSETAKDEGKPKKDTCGLSDLEVIAKPGAPSFAPDAVPNFFVTINNPTAADCTIDLDQDKLSFEVFTLNNYQRVWGDLDCNEPGASGERVIKAGESAKYSLNSWSRTTSAPSACEARQPVGPGGYLLYAHVGDNTSKPATFNLQ
ncbi:hypothetical protein [Corynebacterium auriscanis]|uniref:hypothetical protein n=1 Tax=Corynebacterium auriscanis TaxID=99807 RepID=UPI002245DDAD|nr:hypothetical protein [Corynebacterium auriscanis]MCX2163497.1 hypothetical protein [Corynebacterium auriscanis]